MCRPVFENDAATDSPEADSMTVADVKGDVTGMMAKLFHGFIYGTNQI